MTNASRGIGDIHCVETIPYLGQLNLRPGLIALAVRTTWPRPRRLSPLEEAAAEAERQLLAAHALRQRMGVETLNP